MGGSVLGGGLDTLVDALSFPLPLDIFYNKLNHSDTDLANYTSKCKKLCSNNRYFRNITLCSIILRFLEGTDRTSDKKESDYDDCLLFNYWIYDRLSLRFNYNYNPRVYHEFAEIQQVWNDLIQDSSQESYFGKCNPDNSIVNQNDWKLRRDLYDYCVNYELLQNEIKFDTKNCRKHYAYIKGKAHLYKYFKTHCTSKDENICQKFYSKCINYDPDIVLRNLTCYDVMQKEEAAAAKEILSVEPQPQLAADGAFSPDASKLKGDGNHPVTKTGNILLGVVATSMTSGALYKFTPLGRMLRNGFGWNDNNMRNIHGGEYGLFDYAPESFNPHTGGGEEHYIGYHPA
ncbi:Plasmodium vivax Vir protein, putative [Plasmodium vivax]|uniref:Vir protein, putative n=1 Tax=Plasmodium vivax TaxID=5855 RepID=A0A1G4E8A1_PLAVI|nr:Plasmodium vivax Vir protein, putative [Plasmodium vivax]